MVLHGHIPNPIDAWNNSRFRDDEGFFRRGGLVPGDTRISLEPVTRRTGEVLGTAAGEAAAGAFEGIELGAKAGFRRAAGGAAENPLGALGTVGLLGIGAFVLLGVTD